MNPLELFQESTIGPAHLLGPIAQPLSFLIMMLSWVFFMIGVWWSSLSLDKRWEMYHRFSTARGHVLQRTAVWERKARSGTWLLFSCAAVIFLGSVWMTGVSASYKVDLRPAEVRTR